MRLFERATERLRGGREWSLTLFALFAVSSLIQFLLALVNRLANDDHLEVTLRLLNGYPTEFESCFECYHAKLYHASCALLIHLLGLGTRGQMMVACQLLSTAASVLTLLVVWRFLRALRAGSITTVLAFAFVALNPALISAGVQATNNAFIILFSTLTLYALWRYLSAARNVHAFMVLAAVTLAALSKVTGVVLFLFVALALTVQILVSQAREQRLRIARDLSIIIVGFVAAMLLFSPYFHYYRRYGTPFAAQYHTYPPPSLFEKSYYERPGVTSIVDGFFTFRIVNMIEFPYVTNRSDEAYPLHRTSFWSQLYGSAHSIHFSQWPKSWQNRNARVLWVTRIILILALVPTAVILTGAAASTWEAARGSWTEGASWLRDHPEWIFPTCLAFFLLVVAKLSYDYRDFSAMKAVYTYPALLGYVQCFLSGATLLRARLEGCGDPIVVAFSGLCVLLWAAYLVDALQLLHQLWP
jgi:4-amino-4-deoxy-L-arabinose transferase-like glycosyltransferase